MAWIRADARSRTTKILTGRRKYERNVLYHQHCAPAAVQEAAFLAVVFAATDWTWALRFEDLDDDGRIDLFRHQRHEPGGRATLTLSGAADGARRPGGGADLRTACNTPRWQNEIFAFRNLGDLQFEKCQRGVGARTSWG